MQRTKHCLWLHGKLALRWNDGSASGFQCLHQAHRIATDGAAAIAKWARREDILCYVFRLLVEYAALLQPEVCCEGSAASV
jgi:Glycosyl transferase family 90